MIQIRRAIDIALREAAIRGAWPAEWRHALTDDEWALLDKRGDLQRFVDGRATPEGVAESILDNRRTYLGARAPKQTGPSVKHHGNQERRHVHDATLGEVFLADVQRDLKKTDRFQVQAFRKTILAGKRIRDLRTWVQAEARRQDRPTVENGRVHLVAVRVGDEILRRATRRGHPLEWLRQISEGLADFYRWEPADAATYVLARTAPAVRSITANVRLASPIRARSTITLTIGPTATPSEVAALYSRLRAQEFGRVRRLTSKHAALAAFVFRQRIASPRQQIKKWNRRQPKAWHYTFPSVFRRDADLAFGSLMELQPHRHAR